MKNTISILFSLLLFLSFQVNAQKVKDMASGVVKITTRSQDGNAGETGAGIIVGQNRDELFIVTAWHVLKDAESIQIQLPDFSWSTFPARMHTEFNFDLDMAVIIANVPPKVIEKIIKFRQSNFGHLKADSKVASIGHPFGSDKSWEILQGKALDITYETNKIRFQGPGIQSGFSGGALLETNKSRKTRLLGMIINTQQAGITVAVRVDEIISNLEKWRIPYDLIKPPVEPIPKASIVLGGTSLGTAALGYYFNDKAIYWKDLYNEYGDEQAALEKLNMGRQEIAENHKKNVLYRNLSYLASGLEVGTALFIYFKRKHNKNKTTKPSDPIDFYGHLDFKSNGSSIGLVYTF